MRPSGVHHVAVCVVDLGRAERFWVGVLGLAVLTRWDDAEGRHRSTWVDAGGGAFVALERASALPARRADDAGGMHCLALAIERADRDAWRERLRAAGHAPERESAYTLYVRDPEGNLVGLSHYPEPA